MNDDLPKWSGHKNHSGCNWNAKRIRKVSTDGITGFVGATVLTTEEPNKGDPGFIFFKKKEKNEILFNICCAFNFVITGCFW